MSTPPVPAASASVPPPVKLLPWGTTSDGRPVTLTQSSFDFLTKLWAAANGQGGSASQIAVIFGMSGDGTLSPTGVLTISSSEGRAFVLSAFQLPSLEFTTSAEFEVTGSPWSQAGTIAFKRAAPVTVSTLPAAVDGDRNFVTDSSVAASGNFGAIVAGGGTNHVPVYFDGGTSNWRIG